MPDIAIIYSPTAKHPMIISEENIDLLAEHNRNGEIRSYNNEEGFLNDNFDPEILLTWGLDTPEAACAKMTRLKWIQSLSAGVEGLEKLEFLRHSDVMLGKMKNAHGKVMAQTCLAYILCFQRALPQLLIQQKAHIWKKPTIPELRDSEDITVGIYGMGDIGSDIARLCKSLNMRVLGCRRSAVSMECVDQMYPAANVYEMLKECDFVINLVPDTPESNKSVNASFFAAMKPSAVFINIGRGATVDMDALEKALREGIIAGAALDAVTPEPLNSDSPLWDMKNVIITPHCSADNPNYFDRAFAMIAKCLVAYQDGVAIPTLIKRGK